ncbi:MAG: hypothetical protein KGP28_01450 [Bdellovibrionales bacterium]|nr:hypothetical protein [Bdellovibrionales bacterium]
MKFLEYDRAQVLHDPDHVQTWHQNCFSGVRGDFMKIRQYAGIFILSVGLANLAAAQDRGRAVISEGREYEEHALKSQKWGFTPQLGALVYEDPSGAATSRATVGAAFDLNLTDQILGDDPMGSYIGLSLSALYAHPGANNANFFGTSSGAGGGSNLLQIPLDVKIGGYLSDSMRFTVRGGGNIIYRSNASSINLGAGSDSTGPLWKVYPNVGLEGEFKVGPSISIMARPDLTITPGKNLFVAMIGATFLGF